MSHAPMPRMYVYTGHTEVDGHVYSGSRLIIFGLPERPLRRQCLKGEKNCEQLFLYVVLFSFFFFSGQRCRARFHQPGRACSSFLAGSVWSVVVFIYRIRPILLFPLFSSCMRAGRGVYDAVQTKREDEEHARGKGKAGGVRSKELLRRRLTHCG